MMGVTRLELLAAGTIVSAAATLTCLNSLNFDVFANIELLQFGLLLAFLSLANSMFKVCVAASPGKIWTDYAKVIADGITTFIAVAAIVFFTGSTIKRSIDEKSHALNEAASQRVVIDQVHEITKRLCIVEKRMGIVSAAPTNKLVCPE